MKITIALDTEVEDEKELREVLTDLRTFAEMSRVKANSDGQYNVYVAIREARDAVLEAFGEANDK